MYLWGALGVVLWVLLAFWPAMLARKKGHSFIGFFILSVFFFPLSLILALLIKDRTLTAKDIADDKAAERALDKEYDEE